LNHGDESKPSGYTRLVKDDNKLDGVFAQQENYYDATNFDVTSSTGREDFRWDLGGESSVPRY